MHTSITIAPDAQDNGLATMLAQLVQQNLELKPHKKRDLSKLSGAVAIVATDAGMALTLQFDDGAVTVCNGIVGIPDVTIRGDCDSIMSLSNMPLDTRFGLPFATPSGRDEWEVVTRLVAKIRAGELQILGLFAHPVMLVRLTRVMSVNG